MANSLAVDGQMRNLGSAASLVLPGILALVSPLYLVSEKPFWLLSAFQWTSAILFMVGVYFWARYHRAPVGRLDCRPRVSSIEGVWIHCCPDDERSPLHVRVDLVDQRRAGGGSRAVRGDGRSRLRRCRGGSTCWPSRRSFGRRAFCLRPVSASTWVGRRLLKKRRGRGPSCSRCWSAFPGCLAVMAVSQSWIGPTAATRPCAHLSREFQRFGGQPARGSYVEGLRLAIRDSGRVMIPGMFKAYQERGLARSESVGLFSRVPLSGGGMGGGSFAKRPTRCC